MSTYTSQYKKFIETAKPVKSGDISKGKFYIIKNYSYAEGGSQSYTETTAPVIFVLYVSAAKDIVHAVKVSNVSPNSIKSFFGNFIDEKADKIKMKGSGKKIYENITSKIPAITSRAYRTYKLSGIGKVMELVLDVEKITPRDKLVRNKKNKKDDT